MVAATDGCGWHGKRCATKVASEAGDGGHHGTGEGGELSDRRQVVESIPGASGAAVSQARCTVASNLCALGSEVPVSGKPLCHARQTRRMRSQIRKLHTYLGRVVRDIERKFASDDELQQVFAEELLMVRRLLAQKKDSSNKLYSLHVPEVECISKGKVHKRYEFGAKASVTVTNRSNFAVGWMALPGNPYDGHTLKRVLEQVRAFSEQGIEEVFANRGYRGHDETDSSV